MIPRVHSSVLSGIDAVNCEVEADVTDANEPITKLVGMADTAVKESVSRIQAALRNSGYRWSGMKQGWAAPKGAAHLRFLLAMPGIHLRRVKGKVIV